MKIISFQVLMEDWASGKIGLNVTSSVVLDLNTGREIVTIQRQKVGEKIAVSLDPYRKAKHARSKSAQVNQCLIVQSFNRLIEPMFNVL